MRLRSLSVGVSSLSILLLAPVVARAQHWPGERSSEPVRVRSFVCGSSDRFRGVSGRIDSSMFAPGSGFAELRDVELVDEYMGSRLSCLQANEPRSWGCLGYAFDTVGRGVIEAHLSFPAQGSGGTFEYRIGGGPLRGWNCSAQ